MTSINSETKYSEPAYARADRKKEDVPYYSPNIDSHLIPATQQLLETYSGIPKAEQSKHVHEIRDQAWAIRTYPCTGLGVWLVPYIAYSPAYSDTIQRLKAGEKLLDVGCHIGSDMRRLVADGAPSNNMYAIDIVSHWDVGFNLYHDRDRFDAHFIQADFLSNDPALSAFSNDVDIISVSAVLHQWSWQDQITAAKKLVTFSKPNTIIVGHQIGGITAGPVSLPGAKEQNWKHNAESWEKMWRQVGQETNTVWKIEASLVNFEDLDWDPKSVRFLGPDARVLTWVITRVS